MPVSQLPVDSAGAEAPNILSHSPVATCICSVEWVLLGRESALKCSNVDCKKFPLTLL